MQQRQPCQRPTRAIDGAPVAVVQTHRCNGRVAEGFCSEALLRDDVSSRQTLACGSATRNIEADAKHVTISWSGANGCQVDRSC